MAHEAEEGNGDKNSASDASRSVNMVSESETLLLHSEEATFVKASPAVDVFTALNKLAENFKHHVDQAVAEIKDQQKRECDTMLTVLKQESAKREQRLHSQLLLQSEYMVALETKVLRLEAKLERREAAMRQQLQSHQQQRSYSHQVHIPNRLLPTTFTTINESTVEPAPPTTEVNSPVAEGTPANMAVISSSGASLASGVTAGSFLGEDGEDEDDDSAADDDRSENRSDALAFDSGNPVLREVENEDGDNRGDDNRHLSEQSTPTLGSRPRVAVGENGTLESILLNPMISETNLQGLSVRATRGQDTDGNSSLATSVTNSTFTSTVVTSTTRGDGSTINVRRLLPEQPSEVNINTPSRRGRTATADDTTISREEPRSRSQSPLTVATHASEALSLASASTVGTSIRSSVAVAPRSGFSRRAMPAGLSLTGSTVPSELRPLPDRVVSFTRDLTSLPAPPDSVEAADSITMPDELENYSEVAENFANSASAWRQEYEARLDALHKRWSNE